MLGFLGIVFVGGLYLGFVKRVLRLGHRLCALIQTATDLGAKIAGRIAHPFPQPKVRTIKGSGASPAP